MLHWLPSGEQPSLSLQSACFLTKPLPEVTYFWEHDRVARVTGHCAASLAMPASILPVRPSAGFRYHPSCLGMSEEEAQKMPRFTCKNCTGKRGPPPDVPQAVPKEVP